MDGVFAENLYDILELIWKYINLGGVNGLNSVRTHTI